MHFVYMNYMFGYSFRKIFQDKFYLLFFSFNHRHYQFWNYFSETGLFSRISYCRIAHCSNDFTALTLASYASPYEKEFPQDSFWRRDVYLWWIVKIMIFLENRRMSFVFTVCLHIFSLSIKHVSYTQAHSCHICVENILVYHI